MNDSYGKVISFILLAVLLFIVPVKIRAENQKITEKMYLYTEVSALCEQVKNTGVLTDYAYENLCRMAGNVLNAYEVEIWSLNSDGSIVVSEEICGLLETYGQYCFSRGDYIRILIKDRAGVKVYCGGMIKYNESS